ncbi:hypothetical protein SAMN05421690_102931 [Nitrosomonas sp. Nm51]|uniref:hypothetical protein n=1 Tax=Nitrosomonas sp. Nm51 TaxID=133720 RepID=UPI0008AAC0ED|nr:hypothetical protein [Nitrosomonas sp. Nm51]SER47375.1 hypothetical protein SAMN05421690_102931 [Nitrosomonas sp. Nm51]
MITLIIRGKAAWVASIILGIFLLILGILGITGVISALADSGMFMTIAGALFTVFGVVFLITSYAANE